MPKAQRKRIALNYHPRPWQLECHKRKERFRVLALHRRAGKTHLAVMELIDKALRSKESSMFVYLAPFLKQAKAIAWGRLKELVSPLIRHGQCDVSEGELSVKFSNKAIIRLFGADNPDAMRGLGLSGVVVDEVAQIKPEVWLDILQPCLADQLGWAMFIGTPKGVNLFSELYMQAAHLEGWWAKMWTVYQTNALDAEEVKRMANPLVMPENTFAREMLCDFTAAGDDQLISLADVITATQRVYTDQSMAPRIIGVDPARFGDDRSVIVKRQGLQMFDPIIFQGIDNMQLASRVSSVIQEWHPHAVFVDAGAGAGVIDRLRQLGNAIIEVPFGGKSGKPQEYLNRRAEIWFEMRDWLTSGGAIPDLMSLQQELATPIYWFDAVGRKVLESKDDIKKRLPGAGSPDIADALALTFSAPVYRATALEQARGPVVEWDPYQRRTEHRRNEVGHDPYRAR